MRDMPVEWAPNLDAVLVAPAYHRLAFENESVRVLETRIEPGETVPLHTHRWPAAYYVLSWSDFVRRDEQGAITLDTRITNLTLDPGQSIWSDPLPPHTLENVGETAIHLVSVEVKPSRPNA